MNRWRPRTSTAFLPAKRGFRSFSTTAPKRTYLNFWLILITPFLRDFSMNKAPNTSKQYHLARQTVFRGHCKQAYSCQIGRRQTAYIEYILKCLFIWQC
jgi:hypothetical protein